MADKSFMPSLANAVGDTAVDLYNAQRQFRERYPLADAAIGFVPFVGAAAAADDVANSLYAGDYKGAALNALGFIPGEKLVKGVFKGADAVEHMARVATVRGPMPHLVHDAGNAARAGVLGTGTIAGSAYAADVLRRQEEANRKK